MATKELGEFDMHAWADMFAGVIRAVKSDKTSMKLQNQYYRDAEQPLDTRQ